MRHSLQQGHLISSSLLVREKSAIAVYEHKSSALSAHSTLKSCRIDFNQHAVEENKRAQRGCYSTDHHSLQRARVQHACGQCIEFTCKAVTSISTTPPLRYMVRFLYNFSPVCSVDGYSVWSSSCSVGGMKRQCDPLDAVLCARARTCVCVCVLCVCVTARALVAAAPPAPLSLSVST